MKTHPITECVCRAIVGFIHRCLLAFVLKKVCSPPGFPTCIGRRRSPLISPTDSGVIYFRISLLLHINSSQSISSSGRHCTDVSAKLMAVLRQSVCCYHLLSWCISPMFSWLSSASFRATIPCIILSIQFAYSSSFLTSILSQISHFVADLSVRESFRFTTSALVSILGIDQSFYPDFSQCYPLVPHSN